MNETTQHFQDLFFSTGVLPHGSVAEYYSEVTGGLVDLVGEVVGPFRLPQTLAWYANSNFGIGRPTGTPRANTMARDAAVAADPTSTSGRTTTTATASSTRSSSSTPAPAARQTGNPDDIWSHKWVLPSAYSADGDPDLRLPDHPRGREDRRLRARAGPPAVRLPRPLRHRRHAPKGVGNWCLMGGGSWNGGGDVPAHPSAWCKIKQGWASVTNVTAQRHASRSPDVKTSKTVHRLWKDGAAGRSTSCWRTGSGPGYDAKLPGDGLLIWHVDESSGPTPTRTTTWSGWCRPTASATWSAVATAATPATPTRARARTRRSPRRQRRTRTPTPARTPRSR